MRLSRQLCATLGVSAFGCLFLSAIAQQPTPSLPANNSAHKSVLFSRSDDDSSTTPPAQDSTNSPSTSHDLSIASPAQTAQNTTISPSDSDRDAVVIDRYLLDIHLTPDTSQIAVHARLTVRNSGATPLKFLPLSITSTTHWESISINGRKLPASDWKEAQLDTDADHTGAVSEAQISLAAAPLAPNATLELSAFYSGSIEPSAARLTRIGAPVVDAAASDWDRISPDFIGLRGFGNVLWVPAAAPPLFLGDGAKLFHYVGLTRQREQSAPFTARVTVQFTAGSPKYLILNGIHKEFAVAGDTAVADISLKTIGLSLPALFAVFVDDYPQSEHSIALSTTNPDHAAAVISAAKRGFSTVKSWLGGGELAVLDLPEPGDQPFEDSGVFALAMPATESSSLSLQMAHALARSAAASKPAWMQEGLAQFVALLWMEQEGGRSAAIAEMQQHTPALVLAESETPASADAGTGQPLPTATDAIFYRNKAADVWWMLRDLAGDTALRHALTEIPSDDSPETAIAHLRAALEQSTGRTLDWFFEDWMLHDKGLPDLGVVNVVARELDGGQYLVSVEVVNDGTAACEVPVAIRAGAVSITNRLLVPAHAHATTRVVFNGVPAKVQVNDGSVPEMRTSEHTQLIRLEGNRP